MVAGNRKLQADHFQRIADLDGGTTDDMCQRDSCWDRGAGVIPCWVFTVGGGERCGVCDHLRECHPKNGEAEQKAFFAKLMREVDEGAAKARAKLDKGADQ